MMKPDITIFVIKVRAQQNKEKQEWFTGQWH
jgi:hypothetical protein